MVTSTDGVNDQPVIIWKAKTRDEVNIHIQFLVS